MLDEQETTQDRLPVPVFHDHGITSDLVEATMFMQLAALWRSSLQVGGRLGPRGMGSPEGYQRRGLRGSFTAT